MIKNLKLRMLLTVFALLAGAMTLASHEPPSTAEACAWCTGPHTCQDIDDDGFAGCKVEKAQLSKHTGDDCIFVPGAES
ncbi:MAG: hypothetical protein WEB50_08165 [Vicinamibacterales bacterium]